MSHPEYQSYEEYQNRLSKLEAIQSQGIDPYPAKYTPKNHANLKEDYSDEPVGTSDDAENQKTPLVDVAGRLILFRPMGKNAFGQIQDETGQLQVMFNRQNTQVQGYNAEGANALSPLKWIEKMLDLGDIIGVKGHLFHTQRGELTIYVKEVSLLCKTLLPLPDKHAGLHDKETRYRKRWLDLINHVDVAHLFRTRSKILKIIREFLHKQHFMEVETPILQNIYGGAQAKPFTTHLHSLDQNMFLRISLEIALKKLIVGGMERVFELGKVFRNEGIDKNHNPEFTLLEAYAAYWDYNDMMAFCENLFEAIAIEVTGSTKVLYEDQVIDFKAPWKRLTMKEAIQLYASIDVDVHTDDQLKKLLHERSELDSIQIDGAPRGLLITFMFEEWVEEHLIQPHHIIDFPIESTPLCKLHRDPQKRKEGLVERFESYVLGQELSNAYSELNDPVIQRQLLMDQAKRKEEGDEEASPLDEEFIESICQGMPPTGGIGIGVDRLVMLFVNAHSIRDVILFPLMRDGAPD